MLRILVAVDGSQPSLRAVRYVPKLVSERPDAEIHLLNVQAPLPSAVAGFLQGKDVRQFHLDEGNAALQEAKSALEKAGIPYESHVAIGQPAETIVHYVQERRCDLILMSTRGLSPVPNLLLGSVTTKVLHLTEVPVVLVK